MTGVEILDPADRERSLANLKLERDAIVLYERLAAIEKEHRRADAFRAIAANERRHAEIWASRLREAGVTVPPIGPPRPRVRFIIGVARIFGTRSVAELVQALEGDEEDLYDTQSGPDVESIAADEREHAEIWKRLSAGLPGLTPGAAATAGTPDHAAAAPEPAAAPVATTADPGAASGMAGARATMRAARVSRNRDETWHRTSRGGTLRAAIFGINDGLVSNLALVMGVAGASPDGRFIVLAGVAGLLAGASSMAAGEYISMQSQRELFERQIALEREELKIMPEVEQEELARIFRHKGLAGAEADLVAKRLMADPAHALDTMIREELGLDPDELGSPWGAAASSFVAFGIGALVPLVPFLMLSSTAAVVVSFAAALAALFLVGAGVSVLTGRGLLFSGIRQMGIGAVAAVVTFLVGRLIGVNV